MLTLPQRVSILHHALPWTRALDQGSCYLPEHGFWLLAPDDTSPAVEVMSSMNHHEGRLPTTMAISGISDIDVGFRFRTVFFTMSSPILPHRLDTPVDQGTPFCFGIVIPLKPRAAARCWPVVEKRLRSAVASLRRQSSADWEAVIVGHERPELGEWHLPNLSFITVDQPPPTPGPGGRITRRSSRQDKSAKLAFGMLSPISLSTLLPTALLKSWLATSSPCLTIPPVIGMLVADDSSF